MINRFLTIFLAVLPFVSNAQLSIGEWQYYPSYKAADQYNNYSIDDGSGQPFVGYKMIESPDYIYYVSNYGLSSIDKNTDELYSYSPINKLSDSNVNGLWYNSAKKYLFVSYDSGNIDLIFEDGKLVNLPDIKDAVLTTKKVIYDVAFDNDNNKIYVATSFGLVVFNDKDYYVIESGIYNFAIHSVAVINSHVVVYSADFNAANSDTYYYLFFAPVDSKINNFSNFKRLPWGSFWGQANSLRNLSGNKALVRKNSSGYKLFTIDFDFTKGTAALSTDPICSENADYPVAMADGRYFVKCDNKAVIVNLDGTAEVSTLSAPLKDQVITSLNGFNSIWTQGENGVSMWDATTNPATKQRDFGTDSQLTVREANVMKFSPSNRLYINNMTVSHVLGQTGLWWEQRTCILDDNKFEDVTASYVVPLNPNGPAYQIGENRIRDVHDVVEDPEDPDTYYAATRWEGVYKLTKNSEGKYVESAHYYSNNSTLTDITNSGATGIDVEAVAFDKFNNLWALNGQPASSSTHYLINVLPAEARKKATTTASDWIKLQVPGLVGGYDAKILVCQKSDMIFILDGAYDIKLVAYDTKGTASFDDDTYYVWEKFVDQDGKTFTRDRFGAMIEDQDGKVWIGTQNGVLEIANPSDATNPNMTFNRLKVPRNDGSGFADYLLDSQRVLSMAVDGANKKWLGTESSGLYYVSADGKEVLEHFTSENSDLTSDKIYTVACDPLGNSVFVGTPDGVYRYNSATAPSAENYDNVYAFPNPVRPDYTGWISIKGLIDGSRVKIADAAGNVFLDTESEGGMVTWDGCNRAGERVRTGVYYVYASKTGEGVESQSAVTKILVVN